MESSLSKIFINYSKGRNEVKELDIVSLSVEQEGFFAVLNRKAHRAQTS